MFEVGKKYRIRSGFRDEPLCECIWVDGDKAVLRRLDTGWLPNGVYPTDKNNFSHYEEYHEPKVESIEYAAFCNKDGVFLAGRPGGTFLGAENIGAIRITSTDGKLTSVEIIKEP